MLREATHDDADAIANLVNRAYRPGPGQEGWTHESELVAGDRISADQVRQLLDGRGTVLVLIDGVTLRGCVHIDPADVTCSIGMLATWPTHQNAGIGKALLAAAEALAVDRYGARAFKMSVLSSRTGLLAFYERRGYRPSTRVDAYPVDAGIGRPIVDDLRVLELVKEPQARI